jgi:hypothetical protein
MWVEALSLTSTLSASRASRCASQLVTRGGCFRVGGVGVDALENRKMTFLIRNRTRFPGRSTVVDLDSGVNRKELCVVLLGQRVTLVLSHFRSVTLCLVGVTTGLSLLRCDAVCSE